MNHGGDDDAWTEMSFGGDSLDHHDHDLGLEMMSFC